MVSDVEIRGKFDFTTKDFHQLWLGHLGGTVSMDDFICYGKRFAIARIRQKRYHKRIDRVDVLEEMVHEAMMRLWSVAQKKRFPTKKPRFVAYSQAVCDKAFHIVFSKFFDKEEAPIQDTCILDRYMLKLPSFHEEDEIYIYELPTVIRNEILGSLRFPGTQVLGAVRYIMDRIFNNEPISGTWLRNHYGLKNPEFLIEHIRIRIKMVLYDLRKDVRFPSLAEKREAVTNALRQYSAD